MTESEALKTQSEIEEILQKYNIFYNIEYEKKPNLKFIRFKEISIKVTK
jgi:hypothetical protein